MTKFIVILLAFSAKTFAAPTSPGFTCTTNPRTTAFTLAADGDSMVLTTIHYNGTAYMPIHDGIITPSDISYLADVAKLLKNMPMKNEYRFPKSKCKVYADKIITCSGGDTKTYNGLEMEALNIMTEEDTATFFNTSVKTIKVALDINIHGHAPVQEIAMIYAPEDCTFDN